MTSEPTEAFVWIWLPGALEPVVAGRLDRRDEVVAFTYGRTYIDRPNAISIYEPELPTRTGEQTPTRGEIAGCISDAAPDSWGRRVIINRHGGNPDADHDPGILTFLLESGSDRIGALDFQSSATEYVARSGTATLSELAESAARVEAGAPLSPELDAALLHGTAIGGARPKAILREGVRQVIAKFSSTNDSYPVVKSEFVAMELARRAGLSVAPVTLTNALGKDVLLVDRFDRPQDGSRLAMVSALTILGLTDNEALFGASYAELANVIRQRFIDADATLHELFGRITFNILVGNNDDHARNHAAFWDGRFLTLTPAYDICPQVRSGGETAQLMAIGADGWRKSQVAGCVERASTYHLSDPAAREIVDRQIEVIRSDWDAVCELAQLTEVERSALWERQFLNPYALYDY